MSWMKNGSHGIAEKKKVIIMTKNGKQATITKGKHTLCAHTQVFL